MAGNTLQIAVSEFKAKCHNFMDQLARRELDRIVVTRRGRPLAVLTPPSEEPADGLFGCLKGHIEAPADFDYTAPAFGTPEVAAAAFFGFMKGSVGAPEDFDFCQCPVQTPD